MRSLASIAVLLTSVVTSVAPARNAVACRCLGVTASEAFARSAAVFVGRVVQQEYIRKLPTSCRPSEDFARSMVRDPEMPTFGYVPVLRVTFEVDRAWKGVRTPYVTVGDDTGSCQYVYQMGREYLVFAIASDDGLHADDCSRTAPLDPYPHEEQHAAADLAFLGLPTHAPRTEYAEARERHRRDCAERP